MDAQVWKHSARDLGETDILDDYGVHPGFVECLEFGDGIGQFLREDQDIQSDIAFHAVAVEESHHLRQFLLAEIVSAHAGVEFRESEKHSVGAVCHSGFEAIPVPGRGKKFGRFHQCTGAMMIRISGSSWRLSR